MDCEADGEVERLADAEVEWLVTWEADGEVEWLVTERVSEDGKTVAGDRAMVDCFGSIDVSDCRVVSAPPKLAPLVARPAE